MFQRAFILQDKRSFDGDSKLAWCSLQEGKLVLLLTGSSLVLPARGGRSGRKTDRSSVFKILSF